jgi:hypothetical protein
MIPRKFCKDRFVRKHLAEMGEDKLFLYTFSEPLGLKESREG